MPKPLEFDRLLGKLELIELTPRVLEMARIEMVERNISRVLRQARIVEREPWLRGHEPVPGVARDKLKILLDNDHEATENKIRVIRSRRQSDY